MCNLYLITTGSIQNLLVEETGKRLQQNIERNSINQIITTPLSEETRCLPFIRKRLVFFQPFNFKKF